MVMVGVDFDGCGARCWLVVIVYMPGSAGVALSGGIDG